MTRGQSVQLRVNVRLNLIAWCSVVWCGVVWCGVISYQTVLFTTHTEHKGKTGSIVKIIILGNIY